MQYHLLFVLRHPVYTLDAFVQLAMHENNFSMRKIGGISEFYYVRNLKIPFYVFH